MLSAGGNIAIACVMIWAANHIKPSSIFLTAVTAGMLFYGFIAFCLNNHIGHDSAWLWYALKVFGWIFFTVCITSYWTFIDQYYHLQDAKRLYGLFSSSIFIGLASTGIVMRLGFLEPRYLVIAVTLLLAVVFLQIRSISTKLKVVPDDSESESGSEEGQSVTSTFKSIITSRFTLLLMAATLLIQVLSVVTEFNYLSAFDKHFDAQHSFESGGEENAALTLFLGQCIAGVSITNIVFGLFIYNRLVRRFGIGCLVALTPAVLLTTFSGWLFSDALLFPIMGFFVVEGMLYVIDDCNFTLLLNAVPAKLKYKIRIATESFFEPVGMLCSALFLSFAADKSKIVGLILSLVTVVVVIAISRNYFQGIYNNLAANSIHFQRSVKDWWTTFGWKNKKAAEHRLLAIMKQGNEMAQTLACEGLLAFEDDAILPKLLHFVDTMSLQGKIKFIELIGQSRFSTDDQVLEKLHLWLFNSREAQLKSVIMFYLAQQGLLPPESALENLVEDDLLLRGSAILALQKNWTHNSPQTTEANRKMAQHAIHKLLNSENDKEVCMGLKILGLDTASNSVTDILPYLKSDSIVIARAAAAALAETIDEEGDGYSTVILEQLDETSDNEFRLSCLKALEKINDIRLVKEIINVSIHFRPNERRLIETIIYKMGEHTVPKLLALTKDVTLHDRSRLLAGRILGRLALPELKQHLYEIVNLEIERAYFYFYHYHTIPAQHPEHDLQILQEALLTGYHSVIDFIIQLLAVVGSIADCELLSRSLRSSHPKVHGQAVETLEKSCDHKIFRLLQPLVMDLPLEEKMRAYRRDGRTPLSLSELLDKLDQSPSLTDQIMSALLQCRLNMPQWRESIEQQMPNNDKIFHHVAHELLQK